MKKYDKDAMCPKCGSENVGTTHVSSQPVYVGGSQNGNTPEFMRRVCENCRHSWCEETLDR